MNYLENIDDSHLDDTERIDFVELLSDKGDLMSNEEEFADKEELDFGDNKVVTVFEFV